MAIQIQENKKIKVFALILDLNGYTKMVANPEAHSIAQYTRDVLIGGIDSVQKCGGEVVGLMGDAFFAILDDSDKVYECCTLIARDIDKICEYISGNADAFPFSPKGPSVKIGIEYGYIDISTISTNFLGTQKLFAGEAINYAARIMQAESGNRCLFGPNAFQIGLKNYTESDEDDYYEINGKAGELNYKYYKLRLGDIWREGDSEESFWG